MGKQSIVLQGRLSRPLARARFSIVLLTYQTKKFSSASAKLFTSLPTLPFRRSVGDIQRSLSCFGFNTRALIFFDRPILPGFTDFPLPCPAQFSNQAAQLAVLLHGAVL